MVCSAVCDVTSWAVAQAKFLHCGDLASVILLHRIRSVQANVVVGILLDYMCSFFVDFPRFDVGSGSSEDRLRTSRTALQDFWLSLWSIPKMTSRRRWLSPPEHVLEQLRRSLGVLFENIWGGFGEVLVVTLEHTQSDKQSMAALSATMPSWNP